jgi:CheY-like chemotaxis protein
LRELAEGITAWNAAAIEEARLAEQARIAEEARLELQAEEARVAEAKRIEEENAAEEARQAEQARIEEEARFAEGARQAEEARLAEEARVAEAKRIEEEKAEARQAELARLVNEAHQAEEARLALVAKLSEQAKANEERAVEARTAGAKRIGNDNADEEARQAVVQKSAALAVQSESDLGTAISKEVRSLSAEVQKSLDASVTLKVNVDADKRDALHRSPLILAVDDSPTIRKVVAMALSMEGFEVISAADGVEALTLLAERQPDIILSDVKMPRLDGYKLCKFVKKHKRTMHIPVIMLSDKGGAFDKFLGRMAGCDGFVTKPFECCELIATVKQFCAAKT